MDILSTRGVAGVLGVSEATVKRWADAGTLRCFRTPGGHRKFRLRDVKAFLSDQDANGLPTVAGPVTPLDDAQADARNLALAADVDGLVSLVANQHLAGVTLAQTFDRIFAPALYDIGEAWAQRRINAAQEHIASGAIGETLARIRPLVERAARGDRGRAFCGCLGEEHHDLAVRMVALVLASEGYRVATLGANVPAADVAQLLAQSPPAILALSASVCSDSNNLGRDLAMLSEAADRAKTLVVVGGPGFARLSAIPEHVTRLGRLEDLAALRFARQGDRAPDRQAASGSRA